MVVVANWSRERSTELMTVSIQAPARARGILRKG